MSEDAAMIAPTTGFGFGYHVTEGLSLRPRLGLGYSCATKLATGTTVSPIVRVLNRLLRLAR